MHVQLSFISRMACYNVNNYANQSRPDENADEELPHTLLSYCRQIASGVNYLASTSFIHRDLAARNILVSVDGTCKVSEQKNTLKNL